MIKRKKEGHSDDVAEEKKRQHPIMMTMRHKCKKESLLCNWFSSLLRTVSPLFVNWRNGIRMRFRIRIAVFRSFQIKRTERTFASYTYTQ
jgi:hypothetical protein